MVSDFNPEFSFDFGSPEEGRTEAAWEFSGESIVYCKFIVPVTLSRYEQSPDFLKLSHTGDISTVQS